MISQRCVSLLTVNLALVIITVLYTYQPVIATSSVPAPRPYSVTGTVGVTVEHRALALASGPWLPVTVATNDGPRRDTPG